MAKGLPRGSCADSAGACLSAQGYWHAACECTVNDMATMAAGNGCEHIKAVALSSGRSAYTYSRRLWRKRVSQWVT